MITIPKNTEVFIKGCLEGSTTVLGFKVLALRFEHSEPRPPLFGGKIFAAVLAWGCWHGLLAASWWSPGDLMVFSWCSGRFGRNLVVLVVMVVGGFRVFCSNPPR